MSSIGPSVDFVFDDANRERAAAVVRQAFLAAQIGMPSEDPETAVDSLWIILEALLFDHLAPSASAEQLRAGSRADIGTHWRRMVITAVTNTFVLSGDFVQPEKIAEVSDEMAARLVAGELWHARRTPAQGALVLAAHSALLSLDATMRAGTFPNAKDGVALNQLIAFASLGAVMAGELVPSQDNDGGDEFSEPIGRWARDTDSVASSFGIAGTELVSINRSGWACSECGCLFLGRVDGGVAYPDRFAPIGRSGPCDQRSDCICHAAPMQRRVR